MADLDLNAQLDAAHRHELLSLEVHGDTLLVMPRGDETGYRPTVFPSELERTTDIIKSGRFKNLIVDLGEARYFGSRMIGAMVQLRRHLTEQGQMVFCEPGREMRVILETMHVDQIVPILPTKRKALREVSTLTWRDRFAAMRSYLPVVAGLLLITIGYLVVNHTYLLAGWIGTSESRDYDRILSVYEHVWSAVQKQSGENWPAISKKTNKEIQPIKNYYRVSGREHVERAALHDAANDLLIVGNMQSPPSPERLRLTYRLISQARQTVMDRIPVTLQSPTALGNSNVAQTEP
ncbi:MAG: STAS domain-containing protein [Planctomycetaceae bacterium]|nr:STAS domain-containing protein [Planctomycetaceae bacterium]